VNQDPLRLEDLLAEFPARDLTQALGSVGRSGEGGQEDRIRALIDAGRTGGVTAAQLLSLFPADALDEVCRSHGIRVQHKPEMADRLAELLRPEDRRLKRENPTP
jgi:hypothetical protein